MLIYIFTTILKNTLFFSNFQKFGKCLDPTAIYIFFLINSCQRYCKKITIFKSFLYFYYLVRNLIINMNSFFEISYWKIILCYNIFIPI